MVGISSRLVLVVLVALAPAMFMPGCDVPGNNARNGQDWEVSARAETPHPRASVANERGISLDGKEPRIESLGPITTPSGSWPVSSLGPVAGGRAYLFEYAGKPDWWSVCIVRYPEGGENVVDERRYRLFVDGRDIAVSVIAGSMKCADNGEPVAPSTARIAEAVAAGRVVPYDAEAFSGWPSLPRLEPDRLAKGASDSYRPDRIYGKSSSNNAIGVISGQGGEYSSSRGFISGDDAVLIAAALAGKDGAFRAAAKRNREQFLYGLSLPNFAIWSSNHDVLRDPQRPFPGDRAYANEGTEFGFDQFGGIGAWTAPADYPYLDEIGANAGARYPHGRNEAHLFNHGYAYWLATGDPRAAILQQAIMAYALAANYQRHEGRYRIRFNYQRTTLNYFSAMWKLRDVSRNATGPLLWNKARSDRMVGDLWADWNAEIARLDRAGDAVSKEMSTFRAYDRTTGFSDFMAQNYGGEPAYLWASVGHGELLRRLAEHFVLRARDVGGTRGLDDPAKSSLLTMDGTATTRAAVIAKLNSRTNLRDDSFDGSAPHTVQRAYWLLRMADDAAARGWIAPVSGVPEAITRIEAARDRTGAWKYRNILGWKHGAVPFGQPRRR